MFVCVLYSVHFYIAFPPVGDSVLFEYSMYEAGSFDHFIISEIIASMASRKFCCSDSFTAHEGRGAHLRGLEPLGPLADQAEALKLILAGLKYRYECRI